MYSARFSKKELSVAIKELIYGQEEPGFPFHYSFAVRIIVDALITDRPKAPSLVNTFIDFYDLTETLEEQKVYPNLLKLFRSLNAEIDNEFPHQLLEWSEVPRFAYVPKSEFDAMLLEVERCRSEIVAGNDWTLSVEEPEDIVRILDWILQGAHDHRDLLIVLEGSL